MNDVARTRTLQAATLLLRSAPIERSLSMRLLLVEDDPMIGEIVLDTLRAEGFAVDWVRDGAMADTALLAQSYDLVVLDLGLPKRDGLVVLKSLRARKQRMP